MELAHFPVRVLGGQRRDDRTDQHLAQAGGGREDHGTQGQTPVCIRREQRRQQSIDTETHQRNGRNGFDGFGNIKPVREEGEDQIDDQLGHEIDQHQSSQQGIGHAVKGAEGQKKNGRQIARHGHCHVAAIAGQF